MQLRGYFDQMRLCESGGDVRAQLAVKSGRHSVVKIDKNFIQIDNGQRFIVDYENGTLVNVSL